MYKKGYFCQISQSEYLSSHLSVHSTSTTTSTSSADRLPAGLAQVRGIADPNSWHSVSKLHTSGQSSSGLSLSGKNPVVFHASTWWKNPCSSFLPLPSRLGQDLVHIPSLLFQTSRRGVSNRAKLGPEQGSKQPIPPSLN